jgi:flagellar protein FlaG
MSALNVGAAATPALLQTAGTLPERSHAVPVSSSPSVSVAPPPRPSHVEESTAASRAAVDQAARHIEDFVKSVGRSLSFSVDASTGHQVLRVVDPNSGQVIRQLPADETLRIARSIDYFQNVLVHQRA